ncbi:MAG: hypothetical protein AAB888_01020 [Patescibacteria group bacterium]
MAKNQIKDIVLPSKDAQRKSGLLSLTREDIKKKSLVSLTPEKGSGRTENAQATALNQKTVTINLRQDSIAAPSTFNLPERAVIDAPILIAPPRHRKWLFALIVIAILVTILLIVGFIATPSLSSAKINIVPRSEDVDVAYDMAAKLIPDNGSLGFQTISIPKIERGKEIPVTKEEDVFKKAEGPIVIYNSYSNATQRLIKNTRFESPDGKIYRLTQSVVVPGTRVKNGETEPGSIEVTVTADSPGQEYNIANVDFSIPGFKGDPRYGKFYARSKPDAPIAGGFSGKRKVADEKDIEAARGDLKNLIRDELIKSALSQKPADYVMYDDGMFFDFEDGDISSNENIILKDTISIIEKGSVQIIIFNNKELSKIIAEKGVNDWDNSDIFIPEIEKLDFKIKNKEKFDVSQASSTSFSLSGKVKIIWLIDKEALKNKIRGAKKSLFQAVLADFKNVKKADATVRPFWTNKFPENIDKIEVFEDL